MIETCLATLNPMLMLFMCMVVGFILCKTGILPENAGKVMAKLETWVFCPALSFYTMARYCTIQNIGTHAINMVISAFAVAMALAIALPLSTLFVKDKVYERKVYQYALTFANSGYVGDPVVQALFGDIGLSYYKMYTLPISLVIYTWGINALVPKVEIRSGNPLKNLLKAPMVAMLLGVMVGLFGGGEFLLGAEGSLSFFGSTLNGFKACMGPVAMLLAGFTVARYDIVKMLKNKKVYIATALRLIVIPAIIVTGTFGVKELIALILGVEINHFVLFLVFFSIGTPLGLNTIIFPEAFGGDPSTGASMAMISHTLCVISIPLMYALMCLVFGQPIIPIA